MIQIRQQVCWLLLLANGQTKVAKVIKDMMKHTLKADRWTIYTQSKNSKSGLSLCNNLLVKTGIGGYRTKTKKRPLDEDRIQHWTLFST